MVSPPSRTSTSAAAWSLLPPLLGFVGGLVFSTFVDLRKFKSRTPESTSSQADGDIRDGVQSTSGPSDDRTEAIQGGSGGEEKDGKDTVTKAEAHLWKMVQFSFSGALIRAGDKLDIYEKLYEAGPVSASELARANGWSERWLQELLLQYVAAGVCSLHRTDEEQPIEFSLKPSYAVFLRPPSKAEKSLAGMFQFLLPLLNRSTAVVEAVRTGVGVGYDWEADQADDVNQAIDRKNRNWFTYHLVDDLLAGVVVPSTGRSLIDLLDGRTRSSSAVPSRPVHIADVGCGCGASTVAMARRFPDARIFAYESSERAIAVLKQRLNVDQIDNVTVCNVADRVVGQGPLGPDSSTTDSASNVFDFVYTHDVLHDMTNPKSLIRDVYHRLSNEGCWVVIDVDCDADPVVNVRKPTAATLYGFSCLLCLSSSSSAKDGEALGTCGFPAKLARKWMMQAGFRHFAPHAVRTTLPHNSCFIVAK